MIRSDEANAAAHERLVARVRELSLGQHEYIVVRGPTWAAVGGALGVAGSLGLPSATLRHYGHEPPDPRPGDADGVDVSWSMDVDEAEVAELLRWLGASAGGGHVS